jgi:hypothetical protein
MAPRPSYEDGHLIVAAVRLLSHKSTKPPTAEEIADLTGFPPDFARNLVVGLGREGILKVMESPFEIRVEIRDHTRLEDLPRAETSPTIGDELESFVARKRKEVEETEKMLNPEEINKKKKARISKLEEEMKKMKGPARPPFSDL